MPLPIPALLCLWSPEGGLAVVLRPALCEVGKRLFFKYLSYIDYQNSEGGSNSR